MKSRLSSDDELPLDKTIEIPSMTVVRPILHENNKYYQQVFLDDIKYKNIKYKS